MDQLLSSGTKKPTILGNVNLPNVRIAKQLQCRRILYLTLRDTNLGTQLKQAISPIESAVRQDNRIVLDITLSMMSVWQVPRELVQLSGAYGTNRGG